MKIYLIILLLALFQKAQAQSDDIISPEGLQAFEKTLYPQLRVSCVQCHGDGGVAIGHSVSDIREAYLNSKQLVDFSAIETSRFVIKVKAKHWLRHDPNARGMEVEQMMTYLNDWWQAGESKVVRFEVLSNRLSLPDQLPEMKDGQFLTLTWDLSGERAQLPGCSASVEIQRATHPMDSIPGSYRIRNPKMKCNGQNVEVEGIHFVISSETRQFENIYAPVRSVIPKTGEDIVLSPEIMIAIQRQKKDDVAFAIRQVKIRTN